MNLQSKKRGTAILLACIIGGMLGLTAAAVPLYRLFCQATGYGGTTQRVEKALDEVSPEIVTVRFNADVAPNLPWGFRPLQLKMNVHPGEQNLAVFEAVNRGSEPIVGQAAFNVSPQKVGLYFDKIACFCFDEQVLEPGQKAELPVSFFVDPKMLSDDTTSEVRELTLSYTFFKDDDATAALVEKRKHAPAS
jgi:cytochrome c oxidase assembly protein subunit 11